APWVAPDASRRPPAGDPRPLRPAGPLPPRPSPRIADPGKRIGRDRANAIPIPGNRTRRASGMNSSGIAEWFADQFDTWSAILTVFLVILAVLVLNFAIRKGLDAYLRRPRGGDTMWRDAFLEALGPPLRGMAWIIGLTVAVRILEHDGELTLLNQFFPPVRDLAVIAVITWFLIRSVHRVERGLYARARAKGRELDVTASDAISKL